MRSSARRADHAPGFGVLLREGLYLSGAAIARNPSIVGGTTAFVVATAFVWANAVWNQPHAHPGTFFETRIHRLPDEPAPAPRPAPDAQRFVPEAPRPEAAAPQPMPSMDTTAAVPRGDPAVRQVQEILRELDLYDGDIDGLAGPKTTAAVETYQRVVGIAPSGAIDARLLQQLGARPEPAETARTQTISAPGEQLSIANPPLPTPRPSGAGGAAAPAAAQPQPDQAVMRVQAGLKAFGNDDIELDGIVGSRTEAGIREFQSLFGLQVTGRPNEEVYAKMREIGLTD